MINPNILLQWTAKSQFEFEYIRKHYLSENKFLKRRQSNDIDRKQNNFVHHLYKLQKKWPQRRTVSLEIIANDIFDSGQQQCHYYFL